MTKKFTIRRDRNTGLWILYTFSGVELLCAQDFETIRRAAEGIIDYRDEIHRKQQERYS